MSQTFESLQHAQSTANTHRQISWRIMPLLLIAEVLIALVPLTDRVVKLLMLSSLLLPSTVSAMTLTQAPAAVAKASPGAPQLMARRNASASAAP